MTPCLRNTVMAIGLDGDGKALGFATNYNHDKCTGIQGMCGCVHAEAALFELPGMEAVETVVISHSPCMDCAKMLVEKGVKRIMYSIPYRTTDGIAYLHKQGVEVVIAPQWRRR